MCVDGLPDPPRGVRELLTHSPGSGSRDARHEEEPVATPGDIAGDGADPGTSTVTAWARRWTTRWRPKRSRPDATWW